MASKSRKTSGQSPNPKSRQAAKVGLGALLLGAMVWLIGGFTRENALEWVKSICIAVGLALLIRWPIGEPFRIPSGSMEPTLRGDPRFGRGDRVWVNKFVYGVRWPLNRTHIPFTNVVIKYANRRIWRGAEPQRWDLVVFKSVEKNAKHNTLIKRIVGLPGDRIHIANGKVYVNRKALELPDFMPDIQYTTPFGMTYGILEDDEHALVPEGCYLLLGDNSTHSRDGRVWGWLPNEHILGRAACIWWPPSRWHDFTGFSKAWWWRSLIALLGALLVVRLLFGRSWRTCPKTGEKDRAKYLHLYVNRWRFGPPIPFTSFRIRQRRNPCRGELVLYHCPHNADGYQGILLGRVAGLPGERVYLEDGKLEVNGAPVTEPEALAGRRFHSGENVGPFARSKGKQLSLVPEGHFFILSDEALSEDALDSRTVGWVARANLIGVASAIWWPPSCWQRLR